MRVGALGTVLCRVLSGFVLYVFLGTSVATPFASAKEGFSTGTPQLPVSLVTAWRSVVHVRRISSGKGSSLSWTENGSGVVISQPSLNRVLIATNAHVGGCPQKTNCRYRIQLQEASGNFQTTAKARLLRDFPSVDLAFLEVEAPPAKYAVVTWPTKTEAPEGAEVWSIGFPALQERPSKAWGVPRPQDHAAWVRRVSQGRILERRGPILFSPYPYHPSVMVTLKVNELIFHSADTISGNSGGALVNAEGELIGLPTGIFNGSPDQRYCPEASHPDERCFYFAVPASLILEKLQLSLKTSL